MTGISVMYNHVRSRQLEGTYPGNPETGVWPITSLRIMMGWGMVSEAEWPYDGSAANWPPKEPTGLDQIAKTNQIGSYERLRSVDHCRELLGRHNKAPMVSLEITDEWFSANKGRIPIPDRPIIASHSVLLVGYNDNAGEFIFRNSWGASWGDKGYGSISYKAFEQTWVEGWTFDLASPSRTATQSQGTEVLSWGIEDLFDGVFHAVEIWSGDEPERAAWSFAVESEGFLDVEELFVLPRYRSRGHGGALVNAMCNTVSQRAGKPARFCVSHADVEKSNLDQFEHLVLRHGYSLESSPMRWAAYVAALNLDGAPSRVAAIQPPRPRGIFPSFVVGDS